MKHQLLTGVLLEARIIGRTIGQNRNAEPMYDVELPDRRIIQNVPESLIQESVCAPSTTTVNTLSTQSLRA